MFLSFSDFRPCYGEWLSLSIGLEHAVMCRPILCTKSNLKIKDKIVLKKYLKILR